MSVQLPRKLDVMKKAQQMLTPPSKSNFLQTVSQCQPDSSCSNNDDMLEVHFAIDDNP
jgi:hypothetical protein